MPADIKKYKIDKPYLAISCGLGEGPFYERERNSLRFVDIVKEKLHTVDLAQGPSSHKQWDLAYSIGTTADIEGDEGRRFVFGGKSGYGVFERESGECRIFQEMWTDEEKRDDGGGKPKKGTSLAHRMRSNDGAVDPHGRFLVGAMNDPAVIGSSTPFTDEGIVFRLDGDLSLHRVQHNVTIPNGISWSADHKTIYMTDSPSGEITQYPYDVASGNISFDHGKTFFKCPIEGGVPDGHCRDEEGHFWVALFGTGKVVRVSPQGEIVAEVDVPTRCVTCPELCGTDLFITSAAEEEPEKYPWSTKYQGALFKVDVGVRGAPRNKFRLADGVTL